MRIRNTPIVVDLWTRQGLPRGSVFFLTHMHADHTKGLGRTWQHQFYCSHVTKMLAIRKFSLPKERVIGLSLNEAHLISIGANETMTVTLIDANHCPGAVMFLFQGYFGNILYTGDFRYSKEMFLKPPLSRQMPIECLYFDNTYCDPVFKFPDRQTAKNMIIECIRSNPNKRIVIGMRNLGKESLLEELALYFRSRVVVGSQYLSHLQLLGMKNVFTTDEFGGWIIAEPMFTLNPKKINFLMNTGAMVIIPSAHLTYVQKYKNFKNVKVIPYSDHSSYPEIYEFISRVHPKTLCPFVPEQKVSLASFSYLLDPSPRLSVRIPPGLGQQLQGMKKMKKRNLKSILPNVRMKVLRQTPQGVVYQDSEEDENSSSSSKSTKNNSGASRNADKNPDASSNSGKENSCALSRSANKNSAESAKQSDVDSGMSHNSPADSCRMATSTGSVCSQGITTAVSRTSFAMTSTTDVRAATAVSWNSCVTTSTGALGTALSTVVSTTSAVRAGISDIRATVLQNSVVTGALASRAAATAVFQASSNITRMASVPASATVPRNSAIVSAADLRALLSVCPPGTVTRFNLPFSLNGIIVDRPGQSNSYLKNVGLGQSLNANVCSAPGLMSVIPTVPGAMPSASYTKAIQPHLFHTMSRMPISAPASTNSMITTTAPLYFDTVAQSSNQKSADFEKTNTDDENESKVIVIEPRSLDVSDNEDSGDSDVEVISMKIGKSPLVDQSRSNSVSAGTHFKKEPQSEPAAEMLGDECTDLLTDLFNGNSPSLSEENAQTSQDPPTSNNGPPTSDNEPADTTLLNDLRICNSSSVSEDNVEPSQDPTTASDGETSPDIQERPAPSSPNKSVGAGGIFGFSKSAKKKMNFRLFRSGTNLTRRGLSSMSQTEDDVSKDSFREGSVDTQEAGDKREVNASLVVNDVIIDLTEDDSESVASQSTQSDNEISDQMHNANASLAASQSQSSNETNCNTGDQVRSALDQSPENDCSTGQQHSSLSQSHVNTCNSMDNPPDVLQNLEEHCVVSKSSVTENEKEPNSSLQANNDTPSVDAEIQVETLSSSQEENNDSPSANTESHTELQASSQGENNDSPSRNTEIQAESHSSTQEENNDTRSPDTESPAEPQSISQEENNSPSLDTAEPQSSSQKESNDPPSPDAESPKEPSCMLQSRTELNQRLQVQSQNQIESSQTLSDNSSMNAVPDAVSKALSKDQGQDCIQASAIEAPSAVASQSMHSEELVKLSQGSSFDLNMSPSRPAKKIGVIIPLQSVASSELIEKFNIGTPSSDIIHCKDADKPTVDQTSDTIYNSQLSSSCNAREQLDNEGYTKDLSGRDSGLQITSVRGFADVHSDITESLEKPTIEVVIGAKDCDSFSEMTDTSSLQQMDMSSEEKAVGVQDTLPLPDSSNCLFQNAENICSIRTVKLSGVEVIIYDILKTDSAKDTKDGEGVTDSLIGSLSTKCEPYEMDISRSKKDISTKKKNENEKSKKKFKEGDSSPRKTKEDLIGTVEMMVDVPNYEGIKACKSDVSKVKPCKVVLVECMSLLKPKGPGAIAAEPGCNLMKKKLHGEKCRKFIEQMLKQKTKRHEIQKMILKEKKKTAKNRQLKKQSIQCSPKTVSLHISSSEGADKSNRQLEKLEVGITGDMEGKTKKRKKKKDKKKKRKKMDHPHMEDMDRCHNSSDLEKATEGGDAKCEVVMKIDSRNYLEGPSPTTPVIGCKAKLVIENLDEKEVEKYLHGSMRSQEKDKICTDSSGHGSLNPKTTEELGNASISVAKDVAAPLVFDGPNGGGVDDVMTSNQVGLGASQDAAGDKKNNSCDAVSDTDENVIIRQLGCSQDTSCLKNETSCEAVKITVLKKRKKEELSQSFLETSSIELVDGSCSKIGDETSRKVENSEVDMTSKAGDKKKKLRKKRTKKSKARDSVDVELMEGDDAKCKVVNNKNIRCYQDSSCSNKKNSCEASKIKLSKKDKKKELYQNFLEALALDPVNKSSSESVVEKSGQLEESEAGMTRDVGDKKKILRKKKDKIKKSKARDRPEVESTEDDVANNKNFRSCQDTYFSENKNSCEASKIRMLNTDEKKELYQSFLETSVLDLVDKASSLSDELSGQVEKSKVDMTSDVGSKKKKLGNKKDKIKNLEGRHPLDVESTEGDDIKHEVVKNKNVRYDPSDPLARTPVRKVKLVLQDILATLDSKEVEKYMHDFVNSKEKDKIRPDKSGNNNLNPAEAEVLGNTSVSIAADVIASSTFDAPVNKSDVVAKSQVQPSQDSQSESNSDACDTDERYSQDTSCQKKNQTDDFRGKKRKHKEKTAKKKKRKIRDFADEEYKDIHHDTELDKATEGDDDVVPKNQVQPNQDSQSESNNNACDTAERNCQDTSCQEKNRTSDFRGKKTKHKEKTAKKKKRKIRDYADEEDEESYHDADLNTATEDDDAECKVMKKIDIGNYPEDPLRRTPVKGHKVKKVKDIVATLDNEEVENYRQGPVRRKENNISFDTSTCDMPVKKDRIASSVFVGPKSDADEDIIMSAAESCPHSCFKGAIHFEILQKETVKCPERHSATTKDIQVTKVEFGPSKAAFSLTNKSDTEKKVKPLKQETISNFVEKNSVKKSKAKSERRQKKRLKECYMNDVLLELYGVSLEKCKQLKREKDPSE